MQITCGHVEHGTRMNMLYSETYTLTPKETTAPPCFQAPWGHLTIFLLPLLCHPAGLIRTDPFQTCEFVTNNRVHQSTEGAKGRALQPKHPEHRLTPQIPRIEAFGESRRVTVTCSWFRGESAGGPLT